MHLLTLFCLTICRDYDWINNTFYIKKLTIDVYRALPLFCLTLCLWACIMWLKETLTWETSKKPARKAPVKKSGTMSEMEQMANPQIQWKLGTLFLLQVVLTVLAALESVFMLGKRRFIGTSENTLSQSRWHGCFY